MSEENTKLYGWKVGDCCFIHPVQIEMNGEKLDIPSKVISINKDECSIRTKSLFGEESIVYLKDNNPPPDRCAPFRFLIIAEQLIHEFEDRKVKFERSLKKTRDIQLRIQNTFDELGIEFPK